MTCDAKTRTGVACRRAAMPNGRCHQHGGSSTGPPMTRGGRFSKFLPVRLAARYQDAREDPELISVADDLAVLEARLCELLGSLDATDSATGWARAWELFQATQAGGPEGAAAYRQLGAVLRDGLGEVGRWREIAALMEQRRRLAETEGKRLAALQQYVTARELNLLLGALVIAIKEAVPDAETRQRLAADIARLFNRPAHGLPDGE